MTPEIPGSRSRRQDPARWAAPHLVAGRGRAALAGGALLILAGALTDTLAFQNTLELALPRESVAVAMLMAIGATSMALVAAASLGIALAIHRRDGDRGSQLSIICTGVVWLGLGVAMFLVRWLDTSGPAATTFGGSAASHHTPLVALFFLAIYLISGPCTMFELERFYNPEYFAFMRLTRQYRQQAARAARAEAAHDRARSAADLHAGEFDREDHRRLAAIAERQALGAEAANYARVLMASMLADPAKTALTEGGPAPQLPSPAGDGETETGGRGYSAA